MKKEILDAIGKISMSNEDLTKRGDGFEDAIAQVTKAVKGINMITIFPELSDNWTGKKITNFEVDPCKEVEEGVVERCEADEAEFWSVYVRFEEGGADCIADCDTQAQAYQLLKFLSTLIKLFKTNEK